MKSSTMRWTIVAAAWAAAAGGAVAQTYYSGNPGLISSPTVALDIQGHLEVFAVWDNGGLWEIQQTGADPNLSWDTWVALGNPQGLTISGVPVVATNADGRLEVFVQAEDGGLWHNWQNIVPGGTSTYWSGWYSLGYPPGGFDSVPAVGRNSDGCLEVFIWGKNQAMYHMWQQTTGGWSGWAVDREHDVAALHCHYIRRNHQRYGQEQ
jgi:hypothetical protein